MGEEGRRVPKYPGQQQANGGNAAEFPGATEFPRMHVAPRCRKAENRISQGKGIPEKPISGAGTVTRNSQEAQAEPRSSTRLGWPNELQSQLQPSPPDQP